MEKTPPRSPRGDEQGHGVAAFDHGEQPGDAGAEDGGEGLEKEDGREARKDGREARKDGNPTFPPIKINTGEGLIGEISEESSESSKVHKKIKTQLPKLQL